MNINPFDILSGKSIKTPKGIFYLKGGYNDLHGSGYPFSHLLLHRKEGPAAVYSDGTVKWYKNGKLHRVGGPAITYKDGSKEWWLRGNRHNAAGPAIMYKNGRIEWWLNGISYTKEEFINIKKEKK